MGPAARLIQSENDFRQGSLYSHRDGKPCMIGKGEFPQTFDCLGAFLWAYRKMPPDDRHIVAKPLFHTCRAQYGHARLGYLLWEQALGLLEDCQL